MKNTLLLYLILIISTVTFGQKLQKINKFDHLSVGGPFKVTLVKSDSYSMSVDYNGYDRESIEIEERAGSLSFKIKTKSFFDREMDYHEYIEIVLNYVEIEEIEVSMGSIIKSDDPLHSEYLNLLVNMGGEIELEVLTKETDIKVTMGGVAKISGQSDRTYVSTNMGGEIHAKQLLSKEVIAKTNMGGVINISVEEEIEASASLGGTIIYYGEPKYVDTSINLGGEIRKKATVN